MSRIVTTAAAQLGAIQKADSRQAVVARMIDLMDKAKSEGADFIVYPELAPYIVPATAPVQFDHGALHESVARLLAKRPEFMYLTHFGAVRDAQKLAGQYLSQVDAMADAARSLANEPGRHDKLKRAFGDIYIAELRRSGSTQ